MKKRGLISVLILFVLWIIAGERVNNSIKLPNFFEVIECMKNLAFSSVFYEAFAFTFLRSFLGLMLALLSGIAVGMAAGLNHKFEEYFEPLYILLKSIPNISYILIVLIWTNSQIATAVIGFMVMFPMTYANVLHGMKSIDTHYLDVMKVYPESKFTEIFQVYLPLISASILASFSNGLGLTFKVGIMAEILGSVSPGLGRQFQLCRVNVDMVSMFAWTIWLILFLILFEKFIDRLKKKFFY